MKNAEKGSNLSKALLMGTALVSLSSYQANAATGTGSMSAIILTPIVVANQQTLHFGSLTVGGTAGTVAVDTAGTRGAPTGSVTAVTGAGLEQEGILRITAATGVVMDITMQAGPHTVDDVGAGVAMVVDSFNLLTAAGGSGPVTASIVGPATFVDVPVGARLNVGANQLAGTYTGTYTVDVNYQ